MDKRTRVRKKVTGALSLSGKNSRRAKRWYTYLIYIFLYSPVAIVVLFSFTSSQTPSFPISDLSLKWYEALLEDDQLISALILSLQTGVLSAIGAGIVGTISAYGLVRSDFKSRLLDTQILNTIFLAPIVVPWIVTGIAVLVFYNLIGIRGTYISLIFGHILITMPFVVVVVSSQLYGFDRSLEEAAKNLGASDLRAFYEVTLPLISPGIIAGMLFAFTISFDNFTQTYFWVRTGMQTLPIVVFSKIRFGIDPTINAVGTVIVMISLSVAFVAEKLSRRVIE